MAIDEIPSGHVNMTPSGKYFHFHSKAIQASSQFGGSNHVTDIHAPPHAYLIGEVMVNNSDEDYFYINIVNGSRADIGGAQDIVFGRIADTDNPAQAGLHKFPLIIPPGASISIWVTVDGAGPYSVNAIMSGVVEWEPGYEPEA